MRKKALAEANASKVKYLEGLVLKLKSLTKVNKQTKTKKKQKEKKKSNTVKLFDLPFPSVSFPSSSFLICLFLIFVLGCGSDSDV